MTFDKELKMKSPPLKPRRWYRRPGCLIRLLFALLPVLFIAFAIIHDWYEANRPTYYERAADFPVDDLPSSAKNIRYCPHTPFSPLGRSYQFECSEQDYREWVRKTRITRPELSDIRAGDPLPEPDIPVIAKHGTVTWSKVENYLISDWRFEDQGLYLVYDIEGGRAVRWAHSR